MRIHFAVCYSHKLWLQILSRLLVGRCVYTGQMTEENIVRMQTRKHLHYSYYTLQLVFKLVNIVLNFSVKCTVGLFSPFSLGFLGGLIIFVDVARASSFFMQCILGQ